MSDMNQPANEPARWPRHLWFKALTALVALGLAAALLWGGGRQLWDTYGEYRKTQQEAEDSAPVGYLGVHLRKSYNDRPAQFLHQREGRKLLWAAKGMAGAPEFYDVTEAAIPVEALSGGFGNDSTPGIDYPVFERPDSDRGRRLRDRQRFYGLVLADGARAYPADLLKKIEVVNDRDGPTPFAIVFDRSRNAARFYDRRVDGRQVTFGTTGYAYGTTADPSQGKPLLYDRSSKSLWLPEDDALVCVNGPRKGTRLPVTKTPEETTWSDWRVRHSDTLILVGNDRSKPIPTE
jgi:hypothetical protein